MITRCYLEITNICNLNCAFCPKTERKKQRMTEKEFDCLTDKLRGEVKFLYFHLMGEPLLHPSLPDFIQTARLKGFIPILTTNGTLLNEAYRLIEAAPHKIQISIHSHEANGRNDAEKYVDEVMWFAKEANERNIIVVLRLWNEGGYNETNDLLLKLIEKHQPQPWTKRNDGWKLRKNLFIEYDGMFDWPDMNKDEYTEKDMFCYALRNQIGILVDGSVVPCCLDYAGELTLGNLYEQSLEEILNSPRAKAIYDGFTQHKAIEPLCKRCGYIAVSKQFRK